ncbi:hypothetical protein MLD63_08495 [Paracoccus sp. TK19116]|uniref:Uncharacterized protein n=1 Tax=Paracoccus albicereus TaxID=2922394 RepID=A0ABT1MQ69_9RHOB|nr:hypothetical protein [Paracoccus albicereus]MCQ0970460.1 hypothetical protein [Paracoccus albicereus]
MTEKHHFEKDNHEIGLALSRTMDEIRSEPVSERMKVLAKTLQAALDKASLNGKS